MAAELRRKLLEEIRERLDATEQRIEVLRSDATTDIQHIELLEAVRDAQRAILGKLEMEH